MAVLYRKDGFIKTTLGPAVAGAQIYVCAQPANTGALPPSPLASLFSDPSGLVPIVQPIISDGFGHYDYYVAPGLYTEVVAYGGRVQQTYPDQSVGNVSTSGSSSIVFSTNGTPNFNQLSLNLVQGTGTTLISDNFGNTTVSITPLALKVNGVNNSSQAVLNLSSGSNISVTDNGAGVVAIANTMVITPASNVHFSVPSWQSIVSAWAESPASAGSSWAVVRTAVGASTPSVVQATPTSVSYAKLVGTAVIGDNVSFSGAGLFQYLHVTKVFKINAAHFLTTGTRQWVGITDQTNTAAVFQSDNPVANIVGFRYTAGTDTSWTAYCSTDGTHFSTHSTGVPIDGSGALHVFEFRTSQGIPGTVNFFIDGINVGSISSNAPTATTGLTPLTYSECRTTTTGIPQVGCSMFYTEIF